MYELATLVKIKISMSEFERGDLELDDNYFLRFFTFVYFTML